MDELRFASPSLLLLLGVLPIIGWLAWPRRAHGRVTIGSLGAAGAMRPTWRVRFEPALLLLRLAVVALLVVALARPQRGEATADIEGEGIDIVLAFDVSASMTQPFGARGATRLDAAKDVLSAFIERRTNDRVALVAFQGSSITLSPLTNDYPAVEEAVQGADLVRLADGTAIGTAIGESVNVLRGSNAASRIVIVLTDGENNAGEIEPLAAARIAERLGARVYTVGVVGRTGLRSNLNVDEEALRQIADVTGGNYSRAEDPETLERVYGDIDTLEKSLIEGRVFTSFNDVAPYVLAVAALALALEMGLRFSLFRRLA